MDHDVAARRHAELRGFRAMRRVRIRDAEREMILTALVAAFYMEEAFRSSGVAGRILSPTGFLPSATRYVRTGFP